MIVNLQTLYFCNLYLQGFISFVENLLNQVEKFMIHNANRVAVCRKWPMLSTSTQRRIKDAALVVVEFSKPTGLRPWISSANRVRLTLIFCIPSYTESSLVCLCFQLPVV